MGIGRFLRRLAVACGLLCAALAIAPWAAGVGSAALAEVRNPDGVAVIIGNRDYEHRDVPDVSYAGRDAAAFRRYVEEVLGFDPENVIDVSDATRRRMFDALGTRSDPRSELWSYLDPDGGSEVVVFYSGHGVPGLKDGRGYLLPVDADPKAAEEDGYPIDLLYENLGKLAEARSVRVYLDACFSGGSHEGGLIGSASPVYVRPALPEGMPEKLMALTAATGKQIASWDERSRHGLFTHHLLDALYGKGDADGDGSVTAFEAKAYLDNRMTRAARRAHRRIQQASLTGEGGAVLAAAVDGAFPKRPALDAAGGPRPGATGKAKKSGSGSAAAGNDPSVVDPNAVQRAKYERGLSKAVEAKDYAGVLRFLDALEKLGGPRPASADYYRGAAYFHTGRHGEAGRALHRYVRESGTEGEHRERSLDLLLELDEQDAAAFARAKSGDTAGSYGAYLSAWPDGEHAAEVKRLRRAGKTGWGWTARAGPRSSAVLRHWVGKWVLRTGCSAVGRGRRSDRGSVRRGTRRRAI